MTNELRRAAELLRAATKVAVLSGAGASAESGVPTFRASDGLWEGHRIEDVATPMGFEADPRLVWQFYNARRANAQSVRPNAGHRALAALETHFAGGFAVATQNVDGLHQRAGSKNVLELHGSLRRTRCTACGEIRDRGLDPLGDEPECPSCGGKLRPDIVWFHEMLPPDVWRSAGRAAAACDVFLVVGTSAVVYPAAGLIELAKSTGGAKVIEFNLTATAASDGADVCLFGPSGETLPAVCHLLNVEVGAA